MRETGIRGKGQRGVSENQHCKANVKLLRDVSGMGYWVTLGLSGSLISMTGDVKAHMYRVIQNSVSHLFCSYFTNFSS